MISIYDIDKYFIRNISYSNIIIKKIIFIFVISVSQWYQFFTLNCVIISELTIKIIIAMEKITVCEIFNQVDDKYYTLYVKWFNSYLKIMLLESKILPLIGEVSSQIEKKKN